MRRLERRRQRAPKATFEPEVVDRSARFSLDAGGSLDCYECREWSFAEDLTGVGRVVPEVGLKGVGRAWVREGIIPAHRKPGGRKFTFLRHEIFDWLISNRYEPDER